MKAIGFLKEYDSEHFNAVSLSSFSKNKDHIPLKVVEYLKNGIHFLRMLHWYEDVDSKENICPASIQTDGAWIWPAYLPYYLEKGYNITLPNEFLLHVIDNSYTVPSLTEDQVVESIKYYYLCVGLGWPPQNEFTWRKNT